jgi:hypothetical protein
MAQRAKEQEQSTVRRHPYKHFEGKSIWKVLERGIGRLVDNGDLVERTRREYIVGYLCKQVAESARRRSGSGDR